MTAAQVAAYAFPQELPELAQRPDVQVHFDLDDLHYTPEFCGVCESAVGGEVQDSIMAISYRFRLDTEPSFTGICSASHGDRELDDLLHKLSQVPADIVLHVQENPLPPISVLPGDPQGPAQSPPALVGVDEVFNLLDSLRLFIKDDMPNTATVDMSGRDGFEHSRNTLLAHISQLGIQRIQDLESSAAA